MMRRISSEPSTEFQTIGEPVLSQLVTHADKFGDRIPGMYVCMSKRYYYMEWYFLNFIDISVRVAVVAPKIPG